MNIKHFSCTVAIIFAVSNGFQCHDSSSTTVLLLPSRGSRFKIAGSISKLRCLDLIRGGSSSENSELGDERNAQDYSSVQSGSQNDDKVIECCE